MAHIIFFVLFLFWYILFHLVLTYVLRYLSLYQWWNRDPEWLSNLPKITWPTVEQRSAPIFVRWETTCSQLSLSIHTINCDYSFLVPYTFEFSMHICIYPITQQTFKCLDSKLKTIFQDKDTVPSIKKVMMSILSRAINNGIVQWESHLNRNIWSAMSVGSSKSAGGSEESCQKMALILREAWRAQRNLQAEKRQTRLKGSWAPAFGRWHSYAFRPLCPCEISGLGALNWNTSQFFLIKKNNLLYR